MRHPHSHSLASLSGPGRQKRPEWALRCPWNPTALSDLGGSWSSTAWALQPADLDFSPSSASDLLDDIGQMA